MSWPDFQGNALFNTLGNLVVDPACGLTVIDPDDGHHAVPVRPSDRRRRPPRDPDARPRRRLTNAAPISWWLEKLGRYPSSA